MTADPREAPEDASRSEAEAANVVAFRPRDPQSYEAKLTVLRFGGNFELHLAGELEGRIDFACVHDGGGGHTYPITCDNARQLIAALHATVEDIQANCLFDRDPLLFDGERP